MSTVTGRSGHDAAVPIARFPRKEAGTQADAPDADPVPARGAADADAPLIRRIHGAGRGGTGGDDPAARGDGLPDRRGHGRREQRRAEGRHQRGVETLFLRPAADRQAAGIRRSAGEAVRCPALRSAVCGGRHGLQRHHRLRCVGSDGEHLPWRRLRCDAGGRGLQLYPHVREDEAGSGDRRADRARRRQPGDARFGLPLQYHQAARPACAGRCADLGCSVRTLRDGLVRGADDALCDGSIRGDLCAVLPRDVAVA